MLVCMSSIGDTVTAYAQNGNYAVCGYFSTHCGGSVAVNRLDLNTCRSKQQFGVEAAS